MGRRPDLPKALVGRFAARARPEEWFLGELQARILETLATRGPSTVREVVDALSGKPRLAYTTVMTVLARLHEKGIVERKRAGKGYVYVSRYAPGELRDRMAKYLVEELVEDFGEHALVHFASALDRLDRRRIERLRRAARQGER